MADDVVVLAWMRLVLDGFGGVERRGATAFDRADRRDIVIVGC